MNENAHIFVAGGQTLIGAAIRRQLRRQGFRQVFDEYAGPACDLAEAGQVADFFARRAPEYVFVAAGKSGGIEANRRYPAELMRDNLLTACHIIHAAYATGVKKLLYLASSCSYPRLCSQPMAETALLTGPPEPTNEAYAVAKLAGIKLCQAYCQQYGANFIVGIPANAFGLEDDFSLDNSHVIPALLRKMHTAKEQGAAEVEIWGTGTPRREFIFADDLAEACIFVMRHYASAEPINLGGGQEVSIRELAELVREVVGYSGRLRFDTTKPDGMPVKILDSSRLRALGWTATTPLRTALTATYEAFRRLDTALEKQATCIKYIVS